MAESSAGPEVLSDDEQKIGLPNAPIARSLGILLPMASSSCYVNRVDVNLPPNRVREAVEIIRNERSAEDARVLAASCSAGFNEAEAAELLVLVPPAFSRLHLRNLGMVLRDRCIFKAQGSGVSAAMNLSELETFILASELAAEWLATGVPINDYLSVAGRSAEFHAVNGLLNKGSKLEDIRLTDLVLLGLKGPPKIRKPWWRFW